MLHKNHRTRFAPSPSGLMHIGNIRSALISYICAKETNGSFILRIEDTDQSRTYSDCLNAIYKYMDILKIIPDEGPIQGGNHSPYIQSERTLIYKKYLDIFKEKGFLYRCFKTTEELEETRNRQLALGLPPRYEREKCLLSEEIEREYLSQNKPFVWRFKLPLGKTKIFDKVQKEVTYDLSNFSDFPITRQDGSFTFIFANFVDDIEMKISYVIRGQEHFSNTAIQSALYDVLGIEKPLFYHLPLICDISGKKLSKRDFGFSFQDLLDVGYLPAAILNYLMIIGSSFKEEIFSVEEAIKNKIFESINSIGSITYDIKKLEWINKQWIKKISISHFYNLIDEKIEDKNNNILNKLINNKDFLKDLQFECINIINAIEIINCFIEIEEKLKINNNNNNNNNAKIILKNTYKNFKNFDYENLKKELIFFAKENNALEKDLWHNIRLLFTNKKDGISIKMLLKWIEKDLLLKYI
jgi:glutamyl-tRNA synthetase